MTQAVELRHAAVEAEAHVAAAEQHYAERHARLFPPGGKGYDLLVYLLSRSR